MECAIFSMPGGEPGKLQTAINGFLKSTVERGASVKSGPPVVHFVTQSESMAMASAPTAANISLQRPADHVLTVTVFYG